MKSIKIFIANYYFINLIFKSKTLNLSILEKMLEISGSEHKYQYLILLLTFMIWINLNLLTLIIPYLEKQPEVSYILYVSNVVVFFSINT